MSIKLVAIDIDKTLIDDNMEVPQRNIEAVKNAVEKGCHVVIISGRIGPSVRIYMNKLNLQAMVPSLGGCMLEDWDGTVIMDRGIESPDAVAIYDIARKYGQYVLAFTHSDWLTDKENTYWIEKEVEATGLKGLFPEMGTYLSDNRPNKLLVPSHDEKALKSIAEEIKLKLGDRISCFLSSPYYLEIMPAGVTKGTAVDALVDYLKISREEVLCIGDYYNDVDMFKACGISAAVNNAPDDIKKMVDYVSPLDNNHGAVGQIIDRFVNS